MAKKNPFITILKSQGWAYSSHHDLQGYSHYFKGSEHIYFRGNFWVHRPYPVSHISTRHEDPVIGMGYGTNSLTDHLTGR